MATFEYIDKYQIIERLGSGSFAQVYRVYDRALSAEKAIKILDEKDPTSFMKMLEEAQILNRCKHKHIVTINEANIFLLDGHHRVVLDLEYIPEGSLEKALSEKWVSAKDTVTYVRGILLGLEHAHAQGFLHRDVKPGNILLAKANPKLSDFGLATDGGKALIGSGKGYRTHLPPEYYQHSATTVSTDIFAVGITLFRSLSNISDWTAAIAAVPNPVQHFQDGTLINAVGFKPFIPKPLKRVVRKACHPDPKKRFSSATALRQQLDALRFNIDWIRLNEHEWHGCSNGKTHKCIADLDKCRLTVFANDRRVTSLCRRFSSPSEVMCHMHEHVAKTTLH